MLKVLSVACSDPEADHLLAIPPSLPWQFEILTLARCLPDLTHEHRPESCCKAGWGGRRLIEDFYYCYFQLQNCRKTVPGGWRISCWKAETQVGGRLPINHKEAGKEIETGNVNTKMSLLWVSLEAQPPTSLLKAGTPAANKASQEETAS